VYCRGQFRFSRGAIEKNGAKKKIAFSFVLVPSASASLSFSLSSSARRATDRGLGQALDRVAVLREVHDRHARDLFFFGWVFCWG
jgi:hypothetical protein